MREIGKFGSTLMVTCALRRNRLILLQCRRKSETSVQFDFGYVKRKVKYYTKSIEKCGV